MKFIRIYITIVLVSILISCDTFSGCGTVVAVYAPEPVVTYRYDKGYRYEYYTGRYYYPVSVQTENGKRYKIYTSYNTWLRAHYEDGVIVCSN